MTENIIPRETPVRQACWVLKDIEDSVPILASSADRRIERLCTTLTAVLSSLDERITALEHFDANRVYVDRLEAEMAESVVIVPAGFADLESLVRTACPKCGGQYEVTKRANCCYARCVSPRCEMHGALIAVSRELAQAWNDLAQAEDTAYAEAEEESNG